MKKAYVLLIAFQFLFAACYSRELLFQRIIGTESPNTPINGIVKDSLGYMWFGSWNGLYRYDGKGFDVFRYNNNSKYPISNNRIRSLIADGNKTIWAYTFDRKILKFSYTTDAFESVPEKQTPYGIVVLLQKSANQLNKNTIIDNCRFYVSSNKLMSENQITKGIKQFTFNPYMPGTIIDDNVTYFYIDDQQIIWVGTRNGAIYKANANRNLFKLNYCQIVIDHQMRHASARAILRKGNELYIGTNNNGMLFYNKSEVLDKPVYNQSDSQNQNIRSLLLDGDRLWIGETNKLSCYSAQSNKNETIISKETYPGLGIYSVFSILKTHSGVIMAGVNNKIAQVSLMDNSVKILDFSKIIGSHIIMKILEDKNNTFWLATEGCGVLKLKMDEKGDTLGCVWVDPIRDKKGKHISTDMVYSLYKDKFGYIWAATSNGLLRISTDNLVVKRYTIEDGLPDGYLSAVTGDKDGNIWISHKKGISKLDRATDKISNYSVEDDGTQWSFLDGACYNDTLSNTIYFGSWGGFVSFQPDEITPNPYIPKIALKSFYLGGKLVDIGEEINGKVVLKKSLPCLKKIELDYSARDFAISISALNYENSSENKYQYKLEGYNSGWITSLYNVASFFKVPPGKYVFRARVLSPENKLSEEISLNIIIHSPWYATFWAFTFYIVFIGIVLYYIFRSIVSREKLKSQIQIERLNAEKQEELTREKLEFFTNVSHELRTPLTLITDPLRQLQEPNVEENKKQFYFSIINKNIHTLSNLINQILDFRKADTGKLVPQYEKCDMVAVVSDCVESFKPTALDRNIQLSFVSDMTGVNSEFFDKGKTQQILFNVISNAFKYTPDGGNIAIELQRNTQKQAIEIFVKDNGVGIKSDSLKKIFEPFNNEGTQVFYGTSTGMGLALTKKLVDVLDGEISISSQPQEGTSVRLLLPFGSETESFSDDADRENRYANIVEDTKPNVLIVEDHADIQNYLKIELSEEYTIFQEYNGASGVQNALETIPDIIISDVMMPELDGIGLCKRLKSDERTSHIPIILLTAKTTTDNQIEGLDVGADFYMTKPFNMEVLKAQLKSIIDNRKRILKQLTKKPHVYELRDECSNIDKLFLDKIVDKVKNNMKDPNFSTEQLADALCMSTRQLYRKLDAISGSTVYDFITRIRMDEAAKLLAEKSMNVSQVAYRVGYSELSNFSRAFKKHFGCSPSKYT